MSKILYSILWGLIYTASFMPLKFLYFISDMTAFVLNHFVRYRRTTIDINLARSFPELKYWEFAQIRKEYYRYMCDIALESIWAVTASQKRICEMVQVENPEVMDDLCTRHNKVVTILAHCGNWEMVGAMCGESDKRLPGSFANHPIILAYKAAQNKTFDRLFRKMRMHEYAKFGNPGQVVESKRIIRHILKDKNERGSYMFIADQSPIPGDRIPVLFLNQPTLMISGPEYVAVKLNLPVVYLGMQRVKRGKYVIKFTPITEAGGATARGFITRKYAKLLEKDIFANKYDWLWSHKRWKCYFYPHEQEEYDIYINKLKNESN